MKKTSDFATFLVSVKVLLRDKHNNVLLLRNNRNEIDLPGGRIEEGEEKLAIAKIVEREIKEEVGKEVRYSLGRPLFQFKIYSKKKKMFSLNTIYSARYYAGRVHLSSEHKSYQWLPFDAVTFRRSDFRDKEKYDAFSKYFDLARWIRKRGLKKPNYDEIPH